MADLNELWSEYFLELDPARRGKLLDRLIDAGAETTAFCHRLYQERYRDKKDPDKQVDNWLWKLVYLPESRSCRVRPNTRRSLPQAFQ